MRARHLPGPFLFRGLFPYDARVSQEMTGLDEAGPPPTDEPPAAAALRRIDEGIGRAETGILIVLVTMLVGVAVYQVVLDKLFDERPTWPYEVVRFSVFFVAMMGASLAAQRKGMFNMDLVTRKFSPRARSYLRIATAVLVAVLCGLVLKTALTLRANTFALKEEHEVFSAADGYLALIAGCGLIAVHFVLHAVIEVVYLASGKIPPDPPHGGH
jgi:TRAP-type C4-dicarboxylate transport system permease small subunit